MSDIITSLQNPQVKAWRALNRSRAERSRQGLFLAEGEHMAGEAVKEGKAQALLIADTAREKYRGLAKSAAGVTVWYLADHVIQALCDAKTPQGIVAVCGYPFPAAIPSGAALLAALDGVQDPGNVGTLLRTMDAAGFHCLLLDEKTADPYGPKALRASMGAVFRVPVFRCSSLSDTLDGLQRDGFEIIAGDLRGESFFRRPRLPDKLCVVIGNEGQGISPEVMCKATMRLKLPIPGGAESLNAAVAGSIMIYDILRERQTEPFSP